MIRGELEFLADLCDAIIWTGLRERPFVRLVLVHLYDTVLFLMMSFWS